MPDLKFKGGKFYFSLLSGSGKNLPLFIPRIHNPDFIDLNTFRITSPPGIVQLLNGDLGITELIMGKVLEPVLKNITTNKIVAEQFAAMKFPDVQFPDVVARAKMSEAEIMSLARTNFIRKVVPKDAGLKAIEKSLITGLMESHKPLVEIAKLLVELLAIAEDIVAMLFGTSIRIFGHNIGFPSRNPLYWNDSLGYSMTLNYALYNGESRDVTSPLAALQKVSQAFDKQMGSNHPLSAIVGTDDETPQVVDNAVLQDSFYVACFNSSGQSITPSQSILNTGRWFKKEYIDLDGTKQIIQAPFEQLAITAKEGTSQLFAMHERMLDTVNSAALDSIKTSKDIDPNTIKEVEAQIIDLYSYTKTILKDGEVDSETQQAQPPLILEEWVGKAGAAQIRRKYYPQAFTTAKVSDDENTTLSFSKFKIELDGNTHLVDVPMVYPNQVDATGAIKSVSVTNEEAAPYTQDELTHFSHKLTDKYVPDIVKHYFLPMQWEEISEYNIVSKKTGAVIRTETEVIPFTVDVESDYTLRLIKVYNYPVNNQAFSVVESSNDLEEAVAYQTTENKYDTNDYFWLVEAIAKKSDTIDDNGDVVTDSSLESNGGSTTSAGNNGTNGSKFNNDSDSGKEWYGLLDKFKIIPKIIRKLFPLLFKKTIPLFIKLISLIKNPSKIGNLLLEIALTDENISKVPQHFSFMKEGLADYASRAAGFETPKTWKEQKKMVVPSSKYFYAGYQPPALKNFSGKPQFILDGTAVAEFGKGAFGKALFSFGGKMDVTNGELVKFVTSKTARTDFTEPATEKEQPIFSMMLNFIKLPFEVVFMIIMWLIKWVKRLVNPTKILGAIVDLITFKWLRDIISKKSLLTILGVPDPDVMASQLEGLFNEVASQADKINSPDTMYALIGFMMEAFAEIFVYNIYKNGEYVRTETEQHDYFAEAGGSKQKQEQMFDSLRQRMEEFLANQSAITTEDNNDVVTGSSYNSNVNYGSNKNEKKCGVRQFKLNDLFPIPFWSDMPAYNLCELPIVALKPLEMIYSFLVLIQEILNGILCMPISILGLEPTLHIPRFGKEIPFANVFGDILERIKAKFSNI